MREVSAKFHMLGYRRKKSVFRIYEREPVTKARFQKVLSEGSNFDNVFLVDEERKDPNTTLSGPSYR